MNTTQIPAYMQPEAWMQFLQNQTNTQPNQSAEMMRVAQNFTELQSQYAKNMLNQWQQLTQAATKPEALPEECNKFIRCAAESTMEHAQNMMKIAQNASANVMREATAKTAKAANKKN